MSNTPQHIKKQIKNEIDTGNRHEGYEEWIKYQAALRGAEIALEMQWIRVEDWLPEMENMEIERSYRVIVLFNGIVQEGYYSYLTKYWFDCRNMIITPTHWQPLPKPPNE